MATFRREKNRAPVVEATKEAEAEGGPAAGEGRRRAQGARSRGATKPHGEPSPSGRLEFLKGFLTRPMEVGSVIPSSQILVRHLLRAADVARSPVVVELGPGTGVLTQALVGALPTHGKLLAIELLPDFARHLERTIVDPRFHLHQGHAAELEEALAGCGETRADTVLSGIPFSTLPPGEAAATLKAIRRCLRPGGRFVAYQVRTQVKRLAEPYFGPSEEALVLRNIPPVRVYTWVRRED
jgi:phosphatidylethanolamine/phosphatidyl-N-methylethanolamine N-methyltransferase